MKQNLSKGGAKWHQKVQVALPKPGAIALGTFPAEDPFSQMSKFRPQTLARPRYTLHKLLAISIIQVIISVLLLPPDFLSEWLYKPTAL